MEKRMTVHEVAEAVGVSSATIRKYEKAKILEPAPRDRNGWRRYDEGDVRRIRKVIDPK